jgi:hypothetical protein
LVAPGADDASAAFEYGTTTTYGTTVAASPTKLPKHGATATASVDGLAPATTYHFRVVVTRAGVQRPGPDATFTTAPEGDGGDAPLVPVIAPAPPVVGKSVAVRPVAGTVRVRTPDGRFVTLATGADVPSGSIVDATGAAVALTSAVDTAGTTQTALFGGGRFVVRQARRGVVDIYLRGGIGPCPAALATAAREHKTRRLWGRDSGGRFRTHGANSVATVRGTRWLTVDGCAGTLTRVTEGVVSVRDLHRHRVVTVRAGHSYLARRGR